MPQQNMPQTDAEDGQTLRAEQYDNMELFVAASEVESPYAGWLVDQRANSGLERREPAS